jgi:hypothetical protein
VNPEEVLVQWGVACSELCEDGGLPTVEGVDELEVFPRWEGWVNGIEEAIAGGLLPALLPKTLDTVEVLLALCRDARREGCFSKEGGEVAA